jgi:RimJ/RimL family protein N-acetyltransferase
MGYASETLRAVLRYLFASVGMRKEGHFRESLWFKGEWVDDVLYAMLRREWLERSRSGDG